MFLIIFSFQLVSPAELVRVKNLTESNDMNNFDTDSPHASDTDLIRAIELSKFQQILEYCIIFIFSGTFKKYIDKMFIT